MAATVHLLCHTGLLFLEGWRAVYPWFPWSPILTRNAEEEALKQLILRLQMILKLSFLHFAFRIPSARVITSAGCWWHTLECAPHLHSRESCILGNHSLLRQGCCTSPLAITVG